MASQAHLEARRTKLARLLGTRPALIAAGVPRPRNYAANLYPYRASSHFLYLFGLPLPGAMGVYDGAAFTLYVPDPHPDQALWEGAPPTQDQIAAATGCPVRPFARLAASLRGRAVATLPAPDAETCLEQSRMLGREIRAGQVDVLDVPLAEAMIALRLQHDDAAIAELRLAADATAAAHRAGMAATRVGQRAWVVRAAMEAQLAARGMTTAYPSIVTPHGEILHSGRSDQQLAAGDLLLADVGAETQGGWAGDVTRTWPVSGRFSPTQRDFYLLVLEAQRQAIAAVRPGTRYLNVHRIAAQALAAGLVDLGILRGDPIALAEDGVVALLFPARCRAPAGPRRARHGGPGRPRRLRARAGSAPRSSGSARCAWTATSCRGWPSPSSRGSIWRRPSSTTPPCRAWRATGWTARAWPSFATCAASASRTTCWSPRQAARC